MSTCEMGVSQRVIWSCSDTQPEGHQGNVDSET